MVDSCSVLSVYSVVSARKMTTEYTEQHGEATEYESLSLRMQIDSTRLKCKLNNCPTVTRPRVH